MVKNSLSPHNACYKDKVFVPKAVFVEVDMRCKYNCAHCYQTAYGMDRNRRLSIEKALQRIQELKALGVKYIVPVSGEVLFDISYLAAYQEAGWNEYLVTSGAPVLHDIILAQKIKDAGFNGVRISAHYFSHRIEGTRSISPITEKQIPKIVGIMQKAGLYVEAFCILNNTNYKEVNDICLQARSDGIRKIIFMNFFTTVVEMSKYCLNSGQIQEVFQSVSAAREKILDIEIDCFGNFGPAPWNRTHLRMAKMNRYCPAGISDVYLAIDGSVYPRHCMLRKDMKMGNFENGFFIITNDPLSGVDRTGCILTYGYESSI